jgi:hypothetical protein
MAESDKIIKFIQEIFKQQGFYQSNRGGISRIDSATKFNVGR